MGYGHSLRLVKGRKMNVSKWPLHKRMALPEWCFGPKWWLGDFIGTAADGVTYFFFTDKPPDVFVLWDILITPAGIVAGIRADVTLCLCNETPVATNIRTLTRLMRQFGTPGAFYDMHLPVAHTTHVGPMKILVEANNQGIGGALKLLSESATTETSIAVLISALPREVPDWVVSGLV